MNSKKGLSKPLSEKKILDYLLDDAAKEKEYFKKFTWYHGRNQNRKKADTQLSTKNLKPGAFLVRDSTSSTGDFVLSVRDDRGKNSPVVEHYKITKSTNHTLYKLHRSKGEFIHGLENLIEHYSQAATTGIHSLEKPVTSQCQPPPAESLKTGRTNVLHSAIKAGVESNVCAMLKHPKRLNINSKTGEGQPVVHLVIELGMIKALQILIDLRFSKTNLDIEGHSALHMACVANQPEMVRMLMSQARCDPTAFTMKDKSTPLHLAAGQGHLECVKALIQLGAPVRPRDRAGDMPFNYAQRENKTDVVQFLDKYREAKPVDIDRSEWLQESLNRQTAVEMLERQGCTDGLFLVRKSSKGETYALSLCYEQRIFHLEIKVIQGVAYFIDDGPFMVSLENLVDHYSRFRDGLARKLMAGLSGDDQVTYIPKRDTEEDDTEEFFSNYEDAQTYDEVVTTPISGSKDKKSKKDLKKLKPEDPLEAMMIKSSHLEIGKELGQGEFGTVFRGVLHKHDGLLRHQESVAIKTLTDTVVEDNKQEFLSEARVMCELHHDNIVKLIGICEGPPLMIIQELVKKGSLLDFLWDYPESVNVDTDVVLWAAQIADGMGYLEQLKFVHRDLAARNILLACKTKVKISDFGLSRAVNADSDYYQASRGGRWPVKWYAPEAVNYGTFSHASDVWSYGVTLYEIYSLGEQPYGEKSGSEVIQMIDNGYRLEKPEKCPSHVYIIMKQCWSAEPHNRPTFADLLQRFKTEPEFKRVNTVMSKLKRSRKS